MKKFLTQSSLLVLILSMTACADTSSTKETAAADKETNAEATYTADVPNMVLTWTAFKFTEKLGVAGTFDNITLKEKSEPGTVEEILNQAELNISTASVNSDNEIRDPKLKADFFDVFNTPTITARIMNANNGKGDLELTMNGITKGTVYDYALKNDTIFVTTTVDLLTWNGQEAVDSLNAACHDLHVGTDGVSKLWPDVDVTLALPVAKQ